MSKKEVLSFPHLGDYYIPIKFLLSHISDYEVKEAPPITKKTIELGTKYSPDFVCVPFKYNLGNFIETLDNGASILFQAGGGCRYGYYPEVQEKILKDLGYDFKMMTIGESGIINFKSLKNVVKKLGHCGMTKALYYTFLSVLMVRFMDKVDVYIRKNIGFEVKKNSFLELKKEMLQEFSKCKGYFSLFKTYRKYMKLFKKLKVDKPKNCLRVGIIGELYTSMEPYASYFLEMDLANMNIEVTRFTNVTYLLYQKKLQEKKMLRKIKNYCKYTLGADGMDNVYRSKYLIDKGFDGIIHIKPFGCTPEIGAIPIIRKVCSEAGMPIIFFSFDSQTSETGIKTRLEAFYDMLKIRKGD